MCIKMDCPKEWNSMTVMNYCTEWIVWMREVISSKRAGEGIRAQ